ncbi:MAG: hypothetical protein MMC33_005770 [Icmadophila ericetorum]|nr:hypothetical protein [Icmadophila ericetorum]
MSLETFKALSFDCYGTLIDLETGMYDALRPLLSRLPPGHRYLTTPSTILERLNSYQIALEEERPDLLYCDVLAASYEKVAQEEGVSTTESEGTSFGHSVGKWPAFPDTVLGLQTLKKHYKLIILSNVDNENISATLTGPLAGVNFDAVYTAENIGSYKPSHNNFHYLFNHLKSEFRVEQPELLHVAHSLTVDHIPAKQLGLRSVWIERGEGSSAVGGGLEQFKEEFKSRVSFEWTFEGIGDFAEAVQKEFS